MMVQITPDALIEKKRLEKREKLHVTESHLRATIAKNMKVFAESHTLLLEGLPLASTAEA